MPAVVEERLRLTPNEDVVMKLKNEQIYSYNFEGSKVRSVLLLSTI